MPASSQDDPAAPVEIASPSAALATSGLSKLYPGGVWALSEVDLEVARGETVVLIGESGCGKTTLLRIFNRLVEPTRGEVWVDGSEIGTLPAVELRRGMGYVQQQGGLLPHWTVERNVELVPTLLGWDRDRRQARAREMLQLVSLDPDTYARRYPRELSGGQRQRVAFARALAANPPIVLLDEPFGALDALTRLSLQEEFLRLKARLGQAAGSSATSKSAGKTMLMVTHDLSEAFRLGDRIGVMRAGKLLRLATPAALREAPGDGYVAALLEQAGLLGGRR